MGWTGNLSAGSVSRLVNRPWTAGPPRESGCARSHGVRTEPWRLLTVATGRPSEGGHLCQGPGLSPEGGGPPSPAPPASPSQLRWNLRRGQWSRREGPRAREGHRCPSLGPADRRGEEREAHHRCRTEQCFLILCFLSFLSYGKSNVTTRQ